VFAKVPAKISQIGLLCITPHHSHMFLNQSVTSFVKLSCFHFDVSLTWYCQSRRLWSIFSRCTRLLKVKHNNSAKAERSLSV